MTIDWDPRHLEFLRSHLWAVLATGRADGSPQQSMVGYAVDDEQRLLVSAKSYTAKWKNAVRLPKVSMTVPDGRVHLVVYGEAETIDHDPLRAELRADRRGVRCAVRQRGARPDRDRADARRTAAHRAPDHPDPGALPRVTSPLGGADPARAFVG
jgi:hypothetical protein